MTATRSIAGARRSGGGAVVEASLRGAGFDLRAPRVALVEAQRPEGRPFARVLVQNAWTVLPAGDYQRLSAPYPAAWRARMAGRRAVAAINIRRAEQVVCLTGSMGDLVRSTTRTPVSVSHVLAPLDVSPSAAAEGGHPEEPGHTPVLVPGTITWYKRPQLALQVARDLIDHSGGSPSVLFAGRDDGTGAWEATQQEARRLGLTAERALLTRPQMLDALRTFTATILPSELESLSLSLSEALLLSPTVIASSLAVHREVSTTLNRTPEWLETWLPHGRRPTPPATVTADAIRASWQQVGEALQLPRQREEGQKP